MKKALIVGLALLNVALVLAVLLGSTTPQAQAQLYGVRTNYIMISASLGQGRPGVYVIDLAKNRMTAFSFDRSSKRIQAAQGRDLARDFQPQQPAAGGR